MSTSGDSKPSTIHPVGGLFSKVWQAPFVDVFKQLGIFDSTNCQIVGDVVLMLDSQIGKRVLRLRGAVSASNFVRIPHPFAKPTPPSGGAVVSSNEGAKSDPSSSHSHQTEAAASSDATAHALQMIGDGLGLTGQYCYIQLRAMASKAFAFHLDVVTEEGPSVRLSFGNMFKTFKRSGQTLFFPCNLLSTKWTVFALHLPTTIKEFANATYRCVRGLQFCSSMLVRSVYTSDTVYTIETLPKEMALPVPKSATWLETYEWIWLKPVPPTVRAIAESAPTAQQAAQSLGNTESITEAETQEIEIPKVLPEVPGKDDQSRAAVWLIKNRDLIAESEQQQQQHQADESSKTASTTTSVSAKETDRSANTSDVVATTEPTPSQATGQSMPNADAKSQVITERRDDKEKGTSVKQSEGATSTATALFGSSGVGHVIHPIPLLHLKRVCGFTPRFRSNNVIWTPDGAQILFPSRELVICMDINSGRQRYLQGHTAPITAIALSNHGLLASAQSAPVPYIRLWDLETMELPDVPFAFQQDPTGRGNLAAALSAPRAHPGSNALTAFDDPAFAATLTSPVRFGDRLPFSLHRPARNVASVKFSKLIKQQAPHFQHLQNTSPFGQAVHIAAQALSHAEAALLTSLSGAAASAYAALPATGDAVSLTAVPCEMAAVQGVEFANCTIKSTQLMAAVGTDEFNRPVINVWDIADVRQLQSPSLQIKPPTLIARQVSDYPINRIRFAPAISETCMLVSCGQSSIRFWRHKSGHLPASSVPLGEHAKQNFTDFAFEAGYGEADTTKKRMYVATATGAVFQVNMVDRRLECIFQLHSGPIHSIAINEGFCVTGSADKYLRVWPLDFADYYLQAQHPAPITAVSISPDGLKVIVASQNGCLGQIDLASTAYQTKLRSHTGNICCAAIHEERGELATTADDGTIRIWGLQSMEQLYEFNCAPGETCSALTYRPGLQHHQLVCGFTSGVIRVMDVTSTSTLVKTRQHDGPIGSVGFSRDGLWLYSAGFDGRICAYDVSKNFLPLRICATTFATPLLPQSSYLASHIAAGSEALAQASTKVPLNTIAAISSSHYPATSPAMAATIAKTSSTHSVPSETSGTFQAGMAAARKESSSLGGIGAGLGKIGQHPSAIGLLTKGQDPASIATAIATTRRLELAPAFALNDDGSLLAATGEDPTILVLFDALRLHEIARLKVGRVPIAKLAFVTRTSESTKRNSNGQDQPAPEGASELVKADEPDHSKQPTVEELVVVLNDASFQRYELPALTLVYQSVSRPGKGANAIQPSKIGQLPQPGALELGVTPTEPPTTKGASVAPITGLVTSSSPMLPTIAHAQRLMSTFLKRTGRSTKTASTSTGFIPGVGSGSGISSSSAAAARENQAIQALIAAASATEGSSQLCTAMAISPCGKYLITATATAMQGDINGREPGLSKLQIWSFEPTAPAEVIAWEAVRNGSNGLGVSEAVLKSAIASAANLGSPHQVFAGPQPHVSSIIFAPLTDEEREEGAPGPDVDGDSVADSSELSDDDYESYFNDDSSETTFTKSNAQAKSKSAAKTTAKGVSKPRKPTKPSHTKDEATSEVYRLCVTGGQAIYVYYFGPGVMAWARRRHRRQLLKLQQLGKADRLAAARAAAEAARSGAGRTAADLLGLAAIANAEAEHFYGLGSEPSPALTVALATSSDTAAERIRKHREQTALAVRPALLAAEEERLREEAEAVKAQGEALAARLKKKEEAQLQEAQRRRGGKPYVSMGYDSLEAALAEQVAAEGFAERLARRRARRFLRGEFHENDTCSSSDSSEALIDPADDIGIRYMNKLKQWKWVSLRGPISILNGTALGGEVPLSVKHPNGGVHGFRCGVTSYSRRLLFRLGLEPVIKAGLGNLVYGHMASWLASGDSTGTANRHRVAHLPGETYAEALDQNEAQQAADVQGPDLLWPWPNHGRPYLALEGGPASTLFQTFGTEGALLRLHLLQLQKAGIVRDLPSLIPHQGTQAESSEGTDVLELETQDPSIAQWNWPGRRQQVNRSLNADFASVMHVESRRAGDKGVVEGKLALVRQLLESSSPPISAAVFSFVSQKITFQLLRDSLKQGNFAVFSPLRTTGGRQVPASITMRSLVPTLGYGENSYEPGVSGFDSDARSNAIWHAETGLVVYSSGHVIVLERTGPLATLARAAQDATSSPERGGAASDGIRVALARVAGRFYMHAHEGASDSGQHESSSVESSPKLTTRQVLSGHRNPICCLALSKNGRVLASASYATIPPVAYGSLDTSSPQSKSPSALTPIPLPEDYKEICIWDTTTGQLFNRLSSPVVRHAYYHAQGIQAMVFDNTGSLLVTASAYLSPVDHSRYLRERAERGAPNSGPLPPPPPPPGTLVCVWDWRRGILLAHAYSSNAIMNIKWLPDASCKPLARPIGSSWEKDSLSKGSGRSKSSAADAVLARAIEVVTSNAAETQQADASDVSDTIDGDDVDETLELHHGRHGVYFNPHAQPSVLDDPSFDAVTRARVRLNSLESGRRYTGPARVGIPNELNSPPPRLMAIPEEGWSFITSGSGIDCWAIVAGAPVTVTAEARKNAESSPSDGYVAGAFSPTKLGLCSLQSKPFRTPRQLGVTITALDVVWSPYTIDPTGSDCGAVMSVCKRCNRPKPNAARSNGGADSGFDSESEHQREVEKAVPYDDDDEFESSDDSDDSGNELTESDASDGESDVEPIRQFFTGDSYQREALKGLPTYMLPRSHRVRLSREERIMQKQRQLLRASSSDLPLRPRLRRVLKRKSYNAHPCEAHRRAGRLTLEQLDAHIDELITAALAQSNEPSHTSSARNASEFTVVQPNPAGTAMLQNLPDKRASGICLCTSRHRERTSRARARAPQSYIIAAGTQQGDVLIWEGVHVDISHTLREDPNAPSPIYRKFALGGHSLVACWHAHSLASGREAVQKDVGILVERASGVTKSQTSSSADIKDVTTIQLSPTSELITVTTAAGSVSLYRRRWSPPNGLSLHWSATSDAGTQALRNEAGEINSGLHSAAIKKQQAQELLARRFAAAEAIRKLPRTTTNLIPTDAKKSLATGGLHAYQNVDIVTPATSKAAQMQLYQKQLQTIKEHFMTAEGVAAVTLEGIISLAHPITASSFEPLGRVGIVGTAANALLFVQLTRLFERRGLSGQSLAAPVLGLRGSSHSPARDHPERSPTALVELHSPISAAARALAVAGTSLAESRAVSALSNSISAVRADPGAAERCYRIADCHRGFIGCAVFDPSGRFLLTAGVDCSLRCWTVVNPSHDETAQLAGAAPIGGFMLRPAMQLNTKDCFCLSLAVDPSSGEYAIQRVPSVEQGEEVHSFAGGHIRPQSKLRLFAAAGFTDGTVRFIDAASLKVQTVVTLRRPPSVQSSVDAPLGAAPDTAVTAVTFLPPSVGAPSTDSTSGEYAPGVVCGTRLGDVYILLPALQRAIYVPLLSRFHSDSRIDSIIVVPPSSLVDSMQQQVIDAVDRLNYRIQAGEADSATARPPKDWKNYFSQNRAWSVLVVVDSRGRISQSAIMLDPITSGSAKVTDYDCILLNSFNLSDALRVPFTPHFLAGPQEFNEEFLFGNRDNSEASDYVPPMNVLALMDFTPPTCAAWTPALPHLVFVSVGGRGISKDHSPQVWWPTDNSLQPLQGVDSVDASAVYSHVFVYHVGIRKIVAAIPVPNEVTALSITSDGLAMVVGHANRTTTMFALDAVQLSNIELQALVTDTLEGASESSPIFYARHAQTNADLVSCVPVTMVYQPVTAAVPAPGSGGVTKLPMHVPSAVRFVAASTSQLRLIETRLTNQ